MLKNQYYCVIWEKFILLVKIEMFWCPGIYALYRVFANVWSFKHTYKLAVCAECFIFWSFIIGLLYYLALRYPTQAPSRSKIAAISLCCLFHTLVYRLFKRIHPKLDLIHPKLDLILCRNLEHAFFFGHGSRKQIKWPTRYSCWACWSAKLTFCNENIRV